MEEALEILNQCAGASPLAGGHGLLPALKTNATRPTMLVDLQHMSELRGIELFPTHISVGAMVSHAEVADSAILKENIPGLAAMVGEIGDPQVRNRATIGGAAVANTTGSDYPAALLALDARLITTKRIVESESFFSAPNATALERDELLTRVEIPIPSGAAYFKIPTPASRAALAGVFAARFDKGVSLAVTGVCANVFRARALEEAINSSSVVQAGYGLKASDCISDIFGDGEYRRHLMSVAAERAMLLAFAR